MGLVVGFQEGGVSTAGGSKLPGGVGTSILGDIDRKLVYDKADEYKERLVKEYPAVGNIISRVKVVPDNTFVKDSTGVGDIEFFGPREEGARNSIIYPTGYEYKHPNEEEGGMAVVYNPENNGYDNIKLDVISHGMRYDEGYKRRYDKFKESFVKKYGGDIRHWYEEEKKKYGEDNIDSYERFEDNYVDGALRVMMIPDSSDMFVKSNYSLEEKKHYMGDGELRSKYGSIVKYLLMV